MRAFLHKVFIEDAPLKVLSLVLSIILFLVRSDWDASTPAYVRINYIEPPGRVITSDLIVEAKVAIRGPWSRASRFTETELDPITIDLSKREDGELRFSDDMVRLPPGLRVENGPIRRSWHPPDPRRVGPLVSPRCPSLGAQPCAKMGRCPPATPAPISPG